MEYNCREGHCLFTDCCSQYRSWLLQIEGINCIFCDQYGEIPALNDVFDFCFAVEVIEHLNDPQNEINVAFRVSKTGGLLNLPTPNMHSIAQKIRYILNDEFEKH